MLDYSITIEPWSDAWWADARKLAEDHFEEVDGGIEPQRPFKLDKRLMSVMDAHGCLKLITIRESGRMIGYYTWNITPDVESEGLLIGQQGAWYIEPGHPRAAVKAFDYAVQALRQMGVQCIYPHHRTQGRGRNIGRFFERRGAKLIQHTYSLWIGGDAHA